jgi:hypothetical protein
MVSPSIARLVVGITGHRGTNRAIADDGQRITEALGLMFARIDESAAIRTGTAIAPTRLHTLLAHGVDQMAASEAAARGWEIVAPLPFGHDVNIAVNAQPRTRDDAVALLAGSHAVDPQVQARAQGIRVWSERARLFELADRDEEVAALLLATLDNPGKVEHFRRFGAATSAQAALAGRVMTEQSDLIIGVWDGEAQDQVGGTGHTVVQALALGTPVLLIDPGEPEAWTMVSSLEALGGWQARAGQDLDALRATVGGALASPDGKDGLTAQDGRWRARSSRASTLYRRIEAVCGGEPRPFRSLTQTYESPDEIVTGSAAPLLAAAGAIPGADQAFIAGVATRILPAFALADGISAWLSDAYRSGMIANFLLSAAAIIVGVAYLPLGATEAKWVFAVVEFLLLASILTITWLGGRRRLHARWFETRRAAEYLRHAPILLLTGVARPSSRWPRGAGSTWPEYAARHALRDLGLPAVRVTAAFLRAGLRDLLAPHVASQRAYHHAKAKRLAMVHHRLDRLAETLFKLAVVSVATYLVLKGASVLHLVPHGWPDAVSKISSFLGVALPTLGASIAGIRFFGDFERFAAISEVTAGRLEQIQARIDQLLAGPQSAIDYASVSRLAHDVDDAVVSEIESWQAVFSGKQIALPA